ncbi:MAG: Na+/H+ antiporter NhaC family protein [Lentisphaeria bacterium]|nr:Na+/H+ antiporter NhaC family protein [Lentisphaeria bacterium]
MPLILNGENEAPAAVTTAVQTAENAVTTAPAPETPAAEAAEVEEEVTEEEKSCFAGTFWALVPPLLAIILALITKEVYSSLFIGVMLGGALAAGFAPLKTVDGIINKGFIAAVQGSAGIFIFLVMLGIVVALINKTGATAAFGRWAQTHVKSRVGAILCTFLLGVLIFIADYVHGLTVGSVMQPVTDAKRISRAKLAYIIDATAAPICMIAPISSWAAAVSQYADGTEYTGLEMFIRAIPYNFYSLLTFVFIIGITLMKIDFGPMALHEKNALEKGDLFTSGGEVDNGVRTEQNERGKVLDMLIPVILLIGISVFALIYVGGFLEGKDFVTAFSDTDATVALPWGALIVLILSIIYLVCRRVIKLKDAMDCIPKGFIAMVPAILILTFATALKNMTTLLEAKEFIGSVMEGSAARLYQFLPAVIFLVACVLAFSTGTSWGTFGILIPIVIGIFPVESPLLFIGMSACLAGAVCGDHCSPISDTTIMASAGARCNHINHVSTQLPYVLTVAGVSFLGFILAGVIQNWFIVFPVTVAMMIGLLIFFKVFAVAKTISDRKNETKEA